MEISFSPAIEAAFAGDETNFVGRRSVGGFAAHRQAQGERLRPVENWRGFFWGPVVQWCSRLAGISRRRLVGTTSLGLLTGKPASVFRVPRKGHHRSPLVIVQPVQRGRQ
jgi:hypothetical protein